MYTFMNKRYVVRTYSGISFLYRGTGTTTTTKKPHDIGERVDRTRRYCVM